MINLNLNLKELWKQRNQLQGEEMVAWARVNSTVKPGIQPRQSQPTLLVGGLWGVKKGAKPSGPVRKECGRLEGKEEEARRPGLLSLQWRQWQAVGVQG